MKDTEVFLRNRDWEALHIHDLLNYPLFIIDWKVLNAANLQSMIYLNTHPSSPALLDHNIYMNILFPLFFAENRIIMAHNVLHIDCQEVTFEQWDP